MENTKMHLCVFKEDEKLFVFRMCYALLEMGNFFKSNKLLHAILPVINQLCVCDFFSPYYETTVHFLNALYFH